MFVYSPIAIKGANTGPVRSLASMTAIADDSAV
jgi:hypothetical protein